MRKNLLILMAVMLLSGCGGGRPTPEPTDIGALAAGVQLIQQDMVLRLTQQAIENERLETSAKMTATQQVLDAAATRQAHQEQLQMQKTAGAATEQAWSVTVEAAHAHDTATAQAQGTGTAQALIGLTATVAARQTDVADQRTKEAPAIDAKNKALAAQAESAQMAAEREQMTNGVIAWGPWVIVLIVLGVASYVVYRKSQIGTIDRDQNGMMPGVVLFHKGRKMLVSMDRMFAPVLELGRDGISAPRLTDDEHQEGTTRRAQAVEAINALPPQAQKQGMGLMSQTFNTASRPTIEVMEAGAVRGWVDEAENKLGEEL